MYQVNCDLAKKPLVDLLYRNIYIYIYRERERERERHTHTHSGGAGIKLQRGRTFINIYTHAYVRTHNT